MSSSTNLGRVQGGSTFYSTATSGTTVAKNTLSPNNISPLVGDRVQFANGDVRIISAVATNDVTCGSVVANLTGPTGTGVGSNPNLIINSNFAINQRDGYFAPVGIVVYKDSACSQAIGTVATAIQTTMVSSSVRSATNVSVRGSSSYTDHPFSDTSTTRNIALTYKPNTSTINVVGVTSSGAVSIILPANWTYNSSLNTVTVSGSASSNFVQFDVAYSLSTSEAQTISGTLYFKTSDCTKGSYGQNAIYAIDRWMSNYGILEVLSNGIKHTSTGPWQGIRQIIENPSKLAGKTLTISAKGRASSGGSFRIYLYSQKSGQPRVTVASSWTDSTTDTIISASGTIPSDITDSDMIYVMLYNSLANVSFWCDWVKFEVGDVATEYTPPIIAEELPKCQRYYEKINNRALFGACWVAGYISVNYFHIVEMRTIPTLIMLAPVTMRTSGVNYTQTSATSSASYRSSIGGVAVLSTFPTSTPANGTFYDSQTNGDVIALDAEFY